MGAIEGDAAQWHQARSVGDFEEETGGFSQQ
jgi:hypothetical protein